MSKLFKYDVITLIELVESRPCLWNKTTDAFKDKIERQNAWNEVYMFLEEDFLQKDKKEQQKIAKLINGKWQNVRDAFIRSLKKRSDQASTKKYVYHDSLQFLMTILRKDNAVSGNQEPLHLNVDDEELGSEVEMQARAECSSNETNAEAYSPRKKVRLQENINAEILKAVGSKITPDEDEAFFISITPSVRRMSEDEKLEFRMSVLQLIKDIHGRRKIYPAVAPSFSPPSSSSISHTATSCPRHQT